MRSSTITSGAVIALVNIGLSITAAWATGVKPEAGATHVRLLLARNQEAQAQEHRAQVQQNNAARQEERQAEQQQRNAARQEERQAEQQQRNTVRQEERQAEQQQQRNAVRQEERQAEQQQRNAVRQEERQAEQQQRNAVRQEERQAEMEGRNGRRSGEGPGAGGNDFGNAERAEKAWQRNERFEGNPLTEARPETPPPFRNLRPIPFERAMPVPFMPAHLNAAQQANAERAQALMQHNLYAIEAAQAPKNIQNWQTSQLNGYLNNYATTLGGQPLSITNANTYVNVIPQNRWPSWYQPNPGWGYSTGFRIGSLLTDLRWILWGWPRYYGRAPRGFIYGNGFVPTPWMYLPWMNRWRQPGLSGYAPGGPPPMYTGPITVEAVEPVEITGPFGAPETINQLVLYNAFYYPNVGRWGYMNRSGYFVWVNPQTQMIVP